MAESARAQEAPTLSYTIQNMHTHPWFWTVALSSAIGWILGIIKGFSTSSDWLKRYMAQPHPLLIFLVDLFVFVIIGAYVGTGIYNPTSFIAALAAGLTWPIGVAGLSTRDTKPDPPKRDQPQD